MSDKDQELSLDDLSDLELGAGDAAPSQPATEEGFELSLGEEMSLGLSAADEVPAPVVEDEGMDLDLSFGALDDDGDKTVTRQREPDPAPGADLEELSFSVEEDHPAPQEDADDVPELTNINFDNPHETEELTSLDLSPDFGSGEEDEGFSLGDSEPDEATRLDLNPDFGLGSEASDDSELSLSDDHDDSSDIDLSEDALTKLREIDEIMDFDATRAGLAMDLAELEATPLPEVEEEGDSDIEQSLVSDDLDLDGINFSPDDGPTIIQTVPEKRRPDVYEGNLNRDLKDISQAYSGEMERMQATLSNLRIDREELLAKIQKHEEERLTHNRQALSMRAELDEKKIELSIIRKKLNDEITDLKDRLKLQEEKKLILEEKYRILLSELDKVAQKNRFDVKKVQMRERELEQKLELLKADSETQIRHRDLKILDLKRKLDAMEFDIESISVQEKRSVESRFELEDKLEKAIKTLRSAITVLEDESDKKGILDALKKNIDM